MGIEHHPAILQTYGALPLVRNIHLVPVGQTLTRNIRAGMCAKDHAHLCCIRILPRALQSSIKM